MDWKQILSLTVEALSSDEKKDDVFEDLILIQDNRNIDNKSYKKLFKISQLILKYKGEQVCNLVLFIYQIKQIYYVVKGK